MIFGYNLKRDKIMKAIKNHIETISGEVEIIKVDIIGSTSIYKEFRKIHHEEFKAIVQGRIMAIFGEFIDWVKDGYGEPICFKSKINGEVIETEQYELYVRDNVLRLASCEQAKHQYEIYTFLTSVLFD